MRKAIFVFMFAALIAGAAYAQETTGEVRGSVVDPDGAALPGVTVTIENDATGMDRTSIADARGAFRFAALPPGAYTITSTLDGFQTHKAGVRVQLGGTQHIDVGMALGAITDVIEVTGEAPLVDVTSTVSGITVGTDELNARMPVQREASYVAMLAPATVTGDTTFNGRTPGQNNISMSGASVAENSYQVNGLNITNFRNGLGSTMVPMEFVEEMQIKTGGYAAEYGRATGGVINMVTKSGSNSLHGSFSIFYEPESLQEQEGDTYAADNSNEEDDSLEANVSLGGAVFKDKLFFFGFVRYTDDYGTGIIANEAGAPGSGRLTSSSYDQPYYGGKIDWNITPSHRVEGTYISDNVDVAETTYDYDRTGGTGLGEAIGEGTLSRGGDNYIFKYTGIFGENFLLSAQYGVNNFDRTDASTVDANPAVYDHRSGSYIPIGAWVNWNTGAGTYDEREAYRMDADLYLGSHSFRAGVDYENNYSFDSTQNSGGAYFLYDIAENHRTFVGNDLPDDEQIVRRRYYNTGGDYTTESNALYLQDSWAVTPNLTLNLGLRYEEFVNKNGIGERFIDIDGQYAPRLGMIWDPSGEGRSKVFASYGQYYLPVAANTNIRMAGNETFEHTYYLWNGEMDPYTAGPVGYDWSGCIVGDTSSCSNMGAVGDVIGYNLISNGLVPDWRATLSSNIKPMSQNELILGYEHMVGDNWSWGVRGVAREFGEVIEDYTIDAGLGALGVACFDPDSPEFGSCASEYRLGNPGSDFEGFYDFGNGLEEVSLTAEELNYPEAERKYYALEFTFKRRFADNWMLQGSYTWSHLYGNYEGSVNSEIGQDDAGITQSFDYAGLMDNSFGNLAQDRRHNLKLFGAYAFDNGIQLGGNFYYWSGRPVNSLGVHPTDDYAAQYGAFSFFTDGVAMPRGCCGTTDDIFGIDGMFKYDFQVGNTNMNVRVDVFNLFNNDGVTEVRELAEIQVGTPDPNYNRTTHYQAPRSVRFGFGLNF